MTDPATREGAGEILELDREARRLVLKRGPKLTDVPLPEALIPGNPYLTPEQEAALERLGRSLLAGDRRYPALESILRREPFDRPVQTTELDEMRELVLGLDGRHLVIQGPPGSGKTWTSGRLIAQPAREREDGRRRLDEPQGDPQPRRRRRRGGRRARALVRRPQEGELREPGVVLRRAADRRRRRAGGGARRRPRRRHRVAVRAREPAGRLPLRRRGGAGLARGRARDGDGGAERRPRRRPAAARPGDPGHASGRERRLGAAAPARRRGDRAARPRPLPRADVPAAPGRLRLHLGGVLRGPARAGGGRARADDPARHRPPLRRGRARRAAAGVAGGGRGGEARGRASCGPRA